MSSLITCEKTNRLGEKVTHFSKRFENIYVSYNHSEREIAIDIDGKWFPVDRFDEKESEVNIKAKIVKAINCISKVAKIITNTSDQKWDKFILAYES